MCSVTVHFGVETSMNDIGHHIRRHLGDVLGADVMPTPWPGAESLPAYLADRYRFLEGNILEQPVLFLADMADTEETPANVRKHIAQIRPRCDRPIVYVRERVTAYNRKRLIAHRVAFLVPGNQLYLPDLGIDLREHFRKKAAPPRLFRPATQAVFIHALLRQDDTGLSAANLAPTLGYSAMSISRAFDDIESAGLAESQAVGRERILRLKAPPRELWARAQSHLRNPVKGRHFIEQREHEELGPRAGLSALAAYSMLAEPQNLVVAMSAEHWASLRQRGAIKELPLREAEAIEVETWLYEPREYRGRNAVDPLSLCLSLGPTSDERVEQALESMMEALSW